MKIGSKYETQRQGSSCLEEERTNGTERDCSNSREMELNS